MVVGYLPYYRETLENYDFSRYTHLHYFTIWPGANGEFLYPGGKDSVYMAQQFALISKRAKQVNTKIIITFGGPADHGSLHFVEMASKDNTRKIFVQSVKAICTQWNADGIDIDWEWAQHTDTKTSNAAFTNLMQDLRTMCDENNLSLSLDVSASSWNGKYYNPEAVNMADYINIMTYTYNGSWSEGANHHSSMKDIGNIGLPYWINKGIPKSKLNIGTAFFGQIYEGTAQVEGSFTKVYSVLYPQIKQLINKGYVVVEDNTNGTYCYSSSKNEIAFFDSPQNAAHKMEYAIKNNYAGVIIWEIGQDDELQTLANSIDKVRKTATSVSAFSENSFPFKITFSNGGILIGGLKKKSLIEIYNLAGAKMYFKKVSANHLNFSVSLPAGIYLLNIQDKAISYRTKIAIP